MTNNEDFFAEVRFSNLDSPVIVKIINSFFEESYRLASITGGKPIYVFRFEKRIIGDKEPIYSAQFEKIKDSSSEDG